MRMLSSSAREKVFCEFDLHFNSETGTDYIPDSLYTLVLGLLAATNLLSR